MIRELAEVVAVNGQQVTVSTELKTGCGSCQQQNSCGAGVIARVFSERKAQFEITSDLPLAVGQQVELLIPEDIITRFSLMLYGLPILALLLVAVIMQVATPAPEWVAILLSLGAMWSTFGALKHYFKNRDVKLQQGVSIRAI